MIFDSVLDQTTHEQFGGTGLGRPRCTLYCDSRKWRKSNEWFWGLSLEFAFQAFCAGGDVKSVTLGPIHDRIDFFRREYQMNYQISKLKKPVVCLLDGIVMGGGNGVAMHTPFRIATEKWESHYFNFGPISLFFRSVCAMPEGLIGFVPDVGSSYFLNRLPDSIGNYLAMTGKNLRGDSIYTYVSEVWPIVWS